MLTTDPPMATVVNTQPRKYVHNFSCNIPKNIFKASSYPFSKLWIIIDSQHKLKWQIKMNTVNIFKIEKLIEEMNNSIIFICKIWFRKTKLGWNHNHKRKLCDGDHNCKMWCGFKNTDGWIIP